MFTVHKKNIISAVSQIMPRTNLYYDPFPWNILRGNMEDPK